MRVRSAEIGRQLPPGSDPSALVFTGLSPMGRVQRETTTAMLARVTTVLDDRISRAERIAKDLLRGAGTSEQVRAG